MSLPTLLVVGITTFLGFYAGRSMKYVRLPSIIGFMLIGAIIGPSFFNLLDGSIQDELSFITEIALGFVAVSIGLELSFRSLKEQGVGIILIILFESFFAFFIVSAAIFLLTGDMPLALIFGAIAPASAPAGTVAVIQEYRARGSLTKALYAVVGFDDSIGIIIFGFVSAFTRRMILPQTATMTTVWSMIATPFKEIGLSILAGVCLAVLLILLVRKLSSARDIFILLFATVLIAAGISIRLHLSLILTNMVLGIFVVNTQPHSIIQKIRDELTDAMPLLFVLFFVLAGANLHICALPSLGLLGLVYMTARAGGLMGGAWLGAVAGKAAKVLKKYLGMGILSQAGVAIGLALIVKHEFSPLSAHGAYIGSTVITTIAATSILFEIIGPILTKIALEKAGEIQKE